MYRAIFFVLAVLAVYIGGFVYDEVGPLFYALALTLLASTPLLLKVAFWKKILLMLPLLILRVTGKILFKLFGKNVVTRLSRRYTTLEQRVGDWLTRLSEMRTRLLKRWNRLSPTNRGYLVLIFLPLALALFVLSQVIRIVRLKFFQMLVEKALQLGIEKASDRVRLGKPGSTEKTSARRESSLRSSGEDKKA